MLWPLSYGQWFESQTQSRQSEILNSVRVWHVKPCRGLSFDSRLGQSGNFSQQQWFALIWTSSMSSKDGWKYTQVYSSEIMSKLNRFFDLYCHFNVDEWMYETEGWLKWSLSTRPYETQLYQSPSFLVIFEVQRSPWSVAFSMVCVFWSSRCRTVI